MAVRGGMGEGGWVGYGRAPGGGLCTPLNVGVPGCVLSNKSIDEFPRCKE